MKIDFNIDNIFKNGTFNIISTNNPDEATFSEIYSGNNNYIITEGSCPDVTDRRHLSDSGNPDSDDYR